MNILRRLGGILLALSLTAIAAPALAQKTFTLNMDANLASVPVGSPQSGVVRVINNSPDGNSNFNSFRLTAPAGILITAASRPAQSYAGTVSAPGADGFGRSFITVTYISPSVGKNSNFQVSVTLSSSSCGGSGAWSADVRSGSQVNGQVFSPSGTMPSTTSPACSLAFQTSPANALKETTITGTAFTPAATNKVKVQTTPALSGVFVTLAQHSCTSLSRNLMLANNTATTNASGVAEFSTLSSTTTATGCKLSATSTGFSSAPPSGTFDVVDGVLRITGLAETVVNPASVTVSLVNTVSGETIDTIPATGSVALAGTCVLGVSSTTVTGGSVTFSNLTFTATPPGTCTIGANGTLAGRNFSTNPATSIQKVATITASGSLICATGTVTTGAKVTVGDWEVVRHNFKTGGCPPINYQATSGGTDGSLVTDPNGFILGTDFFSIVYNVPAQGVLLTHVYTSSPYLMVDGQAPKKTVRYCPPNQVCTNANRDNLVVTPGCLSGLLEEAAIPFLPLSSTERHSGCKRSFGWFAVDQTLCGFDTSGGCVRFEFELLEAKDPPWGMTDE